MRLVFVPLLTLTVSCALDERDDFLVGRSCDAAQSVACDPGQECLPHYAEAETLDDFRCRDGDSLRDLPDGRPAPLAYCDSALDLNCPDGFSCVVDRVRGSTPAPRQHVCAPVDLEVGPP